MGRKFLIFGFLFVLLILIVVSEKNVNSKNSLEKINDCLKLDETSKANCIYRETDLLEDSSTCYEFPKVSYKIYSGYVYSGQPDFRLVYLPDICFEKLAIKNNDYNLCKNIHETSIQQNCLLRFLRCEEVNNDHKDECFASLGALNQNLNECDEIIDQSTRDSCYFGVSTGSGSIDGCTMISDENETRKDFCYYILGGKFQNKSVCDNIINPKTRNECSNSIHSQI